VSNRMVLTQGSSGQALFEYDGSNKRVFQQKQHYDGNNWVTDSTIYYFYGIDGKMLGTYGATVNGTTISWSLSSTRVYFRGGLVYGEDIRGSLGRYFPYGEDRDNTPNDAVKFATYTRDSVSGLDYAVNRYHASGSGRFASPDPYQASGGPGDPGSWNRYAYVAGDPINQNDPNGEFKCSITNQYLLPSGNDVVSIHCDSAYKDIPWFQANGASTWNGTAVLPGGVTGQDALDEAEAMAYEVETQSFNTYSRYMAQVAIAGISAPCQKRLGQFYNLYDGPDSLFAKTNNKFFYDAQQDYIRNLPLTFFGISQPGTVGESLRYYPGIRAFVGLNADGSANNQVVLRFGVSASATTLVHEMLHVYTGLGDADLASKLGRTDSNSHGLAPSAWISYELNRNCVDVVKTP